MIRWLKKYHIGLKILAIVFAVALWAFAIVTENPERTMEYDGVDVQIIGSAAIRQASDLIVTELSNPEVSVRLRGSFTRLGETEDKNIIVRADVSRFTEPGSYLVDYDVSVPNGLTVESKNPEKLRVTIDRFVEKEIDVRVVYDGQFEEGLDVGDAILTPAKVSISGIESVLDNAEYAIVTVSAQELTESFEGELEYFVADADDKPIESEYTTLGEQRIGVSIPVYLTKDIPLVVEKIGNDYIGPENMNVKLSMDAIRVHGEAQVIRQLESLQLGSIDVSDFLSSTSVTFPIELPEGVEFAGNQVNSVTAQVTLDGVETVQISLDNIELENVPENVEASLETPTVLITVRGRAEDMRDLRAEDFRAHVDIAQLTVLFARQIVPVQIECLRTGVELWGAYNVIIITEAVKK